MERVYKKQVVEVLKQSRAAVAKPFGWAKHAYERTAVIKVASTEHELVDLRGVEVPAGSKGLFAHYDSWTLDGLKGTEKVNCVCAIGAVQQAVGEDRFSTKGKLYTRAVEALEAALPKSYLKTKSESEDDTTCVEEFNDLNTTTQRSVINVFDRAIRALEG